MYNSSRSATKRAELLLDCHKRLESRKGPWMTWWQELSDVLLPNKADFTAGYSPGTRRSARVYDTAPRQAARQLVTTIDGLLKPKTARWFWLTVEDPDLVDNDEIKRWCDDATERMVAAIYARRARFIQRTGEIDESLVVLGSGALFTGLNKERNGLLFKSYHLSQVAWDEDSDGVINRFSCAEQLTPQEAIAKFGQDSVHPERLKQATDERAQHTKHLYVQLSVPRDDYDGQRIDHRGKPFAAVWLDVEKTHICEEGGWATWPWQTPRWDTSPTEVYGRSPGMMALPDAKTLQAMGKTLLVAGQKAVDPPTWSYSEAQHSAIRTRPGSNITFSAAALQQLGARDPIGVLEMGKNMPIGLEMQQALRLQVEAAFFKNVFSLPIEGRQMTATEILERKEEFVRTIGPVFGRLETDYIGAIVERVFAVMSDIPGAFAPFPDVGDREVKLTFRYLSPMQQARKQLEMASFGRSLEILMPLMEVDPGVIDNFDTDEIVRDMPEAGAFPQSWLRSEAEVEAKRAAREQEKQAALAAEAAKVAGPIGAGAKGLAEAEQISGGGVSGALQQLGMGV